MVEPTDEPSLPGVRSGGAPPVGGEEAAPGGDVKYQPPRKAP